MTIGLSKYDLKEFKPKKMPWIVTEWCEGCGDCVSKCEKAALGLVPRNFDSTVQVSWMVDLKKCVGCGLCESACPWGAIQMTTYVDEAIERYRTKHP